MDTSWILEMKGNITKRAVDAAKPKKTDWVLWDSTLSGFGLKITPSGSKVYLFQYWYGKRRRRFTIGKHGSPWTPKQARDKAEELAFTVHNGGDPYSGHRTKTSGLTLSELCEQYLKDAPTIPTKRGTPKKASTLATDTSNIQRHIKPLIGDLLANTVTTADVQKLQRDIASGKTALDEKTGPRGRAIVRGGQGTAARSVALLGAIFSYAIEARKCELRDNPVKGVRLFNRNMGQDRDEAFSQAEMKALGDALAEAEKEGVNKRALDAIRLLVLTGCRKNEVLSLRHDYIDWERARIDFPDSKTGRKHVPLGPPALALLKSIDPVTDPETGEQNPYVFAGKGDIGRVVNIQKIWNGIRERGKLPSKRINDLRHSFATTAVGGGGSLYLVGKILGHKQSRTTERYAHAEPDPLKKVASKTSRGIEKALLGSLKKARLK